MAEPSSYRFEPDLTATDVATKTAAYAATVGGRPDHLAA
jgi:hypothetical protein